MIGDNDKQQRYSIDGQKTPPTLRQVGKQNLA